MSRYFASISKEEFVKKIMTEVIVLEEDEDPNDKYAIYEFNASGIILKDLKVSFDFENWEWKTEGEIEMQYPCGYMQLDNKMHCWAMSAGGDWQTPVCFIIYWDGKNLRAYVPKEGNVWARKSKYAFGNYSEKDDKQEIKSLLKEAKRWVSEEIKKQIDERLKKDDFTNINLAALSSKEAIIQDITNRIQPRLSN